MTTGELRPDDASDPAGFVEMLRQLKDRSGLTYRQLEQRAASAGDVLARSTAADILRRSTLPRPEVVAAFVRACGAEDQVETWLRARHRIAVNAYAPTSPVSDQPADGSTADGSAVDAAAEERAAPARARWFARRAPLAFLVVGVLLAAVGVVAWIQRPDDVPPTGQRGGPTPAVSGVPSASASPDDDASPEADASPTIGPDARLSRIHPARNPQLCLTEGRERTRQYPHEVAVQRPCVDATPPDTYLEPAAGGLYFIKWSHPVHGPGCLTIRSEDPGRNLLEPFTKCSDSNPSQLFRFEPTVPAPTSYRIRPSGTDLCVGLRDDDTEVSAEALVEPCTNGADQVFLVDPRPAG
ncbi:helix-turn-helix domain-containing protein [Micromonospora foliorum]|uniref:helix-turn-helix domain-containing protein n=1 Tax=Micromonospora foliorum TaxID=2911210 RepID=UPI001EE79D46|nr:helix-turn-helix domain-containing protein [Micromonospora foliorum]MCG5434556.1 helix-turn-helix domain-containing protein [Micromonospora foliorum]